MAIERFNRKKREEFKEIMKALGAAFNREITADLLRAFELALHDVPIQTIDKKAYHIIRNERWFPRPVDLRPHPALQRIQRIQEGSRKRLAEDRTARKQWIENPPLRLEGPRPIGELAQQVVED